LVIFSALLPVVLLEVGIRVVYRLRNARMEAVPRVYTLGNLGDVPPWLDSLRILEPDEHFIWRGRPHAEQNYLDVFSPMASEDERRALLGRFNPSIPDALRDNNRWHVRLNSEGFREGELPREKHAGVLRVVCIGDSWTFGTNVGGEETYPRRLEALLRREFPHREIEVFNLGMIGYSSFQGLELLKRRALDLQPDVVLIGFAMNDSVVSGWRDRDEADRPRLKGFGLRRFLSGNLETVKLLFYLSRGARAGSQTVGEHLKALVNPPEKSSTYEGWASSDALDAGDYDRLEARTRVSPTDYERNIREMIALVRARGATPVLLHNELRAGSPYQSILQKIARAESVALVDNCAVIGEARRRIERELEQKLALQPATGATLDAATPAMIYATTSTTTNATIETTTVRAADAGAETEVVFRVSAGERRVSKAVYLAGPHAQLGDAVPNRTAMYDDGTHGDQRAGDNVWTFAARFPRGAKIFYYYTESGAEGRWENLDVPKIRSLTLAADAPPRVYRPIETFGRIYMQSDGWHTNADGYALIAAAVFDVLREQEIFRTPVASRTQRRTLLSAK
jgi:lysophospholipase L1-like esterase